MAEVPVLVRSDVTPARCAFCLHKFGKREPYVRWSAQPYHRSCYWRAVSPFA